MTGKRVGVTRAASRRATARLAVICVLCAAVGCLAGGCGKRDSAPRAAPVERRVGYAYTAVLIGHHPLYGVLEHLDWAVEERRLEAGSWELEAANGEALFDSELPYALDPSALLVPDWRPPGRGRMDELRSRWMAGYPRPGAATGELSQDLAAVIEWEREQARQRVEDALAGAQARETRRLAQLRARLVREQQERLANLPLDLSAPEAEVLREAERERKLIWDTIHAQMAAETEVGEQRLAGIEQRLKAEAEARMSAAEQAAREVTARREAEMQRTGEALRAEMTHEIEGADEAVPRAAADAGTSTPGRDRAELGATQRGEANARLGAASRMREEAHAARDRAVSRQLHRLAQARGRLQRQLKRSTEIAALAVAERQNLELALLPGDAPRGNDMTQLIGAELDGFWNAAYR